MRARPMSVKGSVEPAWPALGQRAAPAFLHEPVPLQLHLAHGIAELRTLRCLAELDAAREVLEPELVIEVELVEERRREQIEVAGRAARHGVALAVVVVVLEQDRLEPGRLRDLQEIVFAFGRLEVIEEPRELGLLLEPRFLHDDRETEVDRQHQHAQRPVVLGDEVFERGHHAVALAALVDRVVVQRVEPALRQHLLGAGPNALHLVRLAELLGHPFGHVVEVAAPVRPQHVVHDQHGQGSAGLARALTEHPQLVVHGEPVVVAVDERDVDRRELSAARCG